MQQVIEIKAKYSKDDRLFAVKDVSGELITLSPVKVDRVSNIKMFGADHHITYSVISLIRGMNGPLFEASEINLYTLEEIGRFLK